MSEHAGTFRRATACTWPGWWRVEPPAPVHVLAKFIVVVDEDVDVRDWKEVVWVMTTLIDPARDTMLIEHTPID